MESKVLLPQEMAAESGTLVSPLRMTSSPTIEYITLNSTATHTIGAKGRM